MRRCIYCGIAEDLSDSDIIPDALTASRIINKCVCHVEHNSGMTEKFESEVVEKLAFLLNHLDIKSKKATIILHMKRIMILREYATMIKKYLKIMIL